MGKKGATTKTAENKSKAKSAAPTPKAKAAASAAADDVIVSGSTNTRGDLSNMLGQLSKSDDPNKVNLLKYYKSLERFDSEKHAILKQWSADKTCKWTTQYLSSKSHKVSVESTETNGYGTKRCTRQPS